MTHVNNCLPPHPPLDLCCSLHFLNPLCPLVRQGDLPDTNWEEPLETTQSAEELVAEIQSVPWFTRQWVRMEEAQHLWAWEEVCFYSLSQFAPFVRRLVQTGLFVK